MVRKHLSIFSYCLALTAGCASNKPAPSQAPAATATHAPATEEAREPMAAVEVDDSPPMALENWRKIKAEGEAAARETDLDARIDKCKAFVQAHPDHQKSKDVLEALTDAMVEKGKFDPEELTRYVEMLARADDENVGEPIELVQKFHIAHDLPVVSGLALLDLSRQRLERAREDAARETNETRREYMLLRHDYTEKKTWKVQGHLLVDHGRHDQALEALATAREKAEALPNGITVRDGQGKTVRNLSSGSLDELYVLQAKAQLAQGDKEAAKKSLAKTLGFVDDLEIRQMYDELRDELGMGNEPKLVVKGAAQPAQKFELEDLDGKMVSLADYKGKVVLVAFWATWCGPCKKELPHLQKFARKNKDKGVELLTINTDNFSMRSKVAPFLKENDLDMKVVFEDPKQLTEYNYRAIPALYVIDRSGKVAHARTGYDRQLEEKLANEIQGIVEGSHKGGRELVAVEVAPPNLAVRWQQPVTGDLSALTIAAPTGDSPGEVAAMGRNGLTRWDQNGQLLGEHPLAGYTRTLQATDLDGDGKREWIVGGWQDVKVLDHRGESYWDHPAMQASIAGTHDFGGDGFEEIVLQHEGRVVVMKAVPEPMWKSQPFEELEAVKVAPDGTIVAQADGELVELDARGRVVSKGVPAPKGRMLSGRIRTRSGEHVDLFEGRWDESPILGHDVDGDGDEDVVVPNRNGLVAYDRDGNVVLQIRGNDVSVSTGVGDLDGKPGDEIVLAVDHYGLVVLGNEVKTN